VGFSGILLSRTAAGSAQTGSHEEVICFGEDCSVMRRHRREGVTEDSHLFTGKGVPRMQDEQNHDDYS
jgi:hypothetical protein